MKALARCSFRRVVLFVILLSLSLVAILVMLVPATFRSAHGGVFTWRALVYDKSDHFVTAEADQNRSLPTRWTVAVAENSVVSPSHTERQRTIAGRFVSASRSVPHSHIAQLNVSMTLSPPRKHTATANHKISIASRPARNSTVNATISVPAQNSTPNRTVFEMTIPVSGQLGNRMFEYASLLGIAHMNDRNPFYKSSSDLQEVFEVTHIEDRSEEGFIDVWEEDFAIYTPFLEHLPKQNVRLVQYLQSWKYFDAIKATIKQEFRFKRHVKDRVADLLKKLTPRTDQKVKIGVHVRRGDMATLSGQLNGYHIAPASYLFKAMDYIRKKHGEVIFLVVTDHPEWCWEELKAISDCIVVDRASPEVHMALLAACDHVIITVGTFGWWGGYLCGGDVVYYWDPEVCLHHPPMNVEIKKPEDFFLPSWIPLAG